MRLSHSLLTKLALELREMIYEQVIFDFYGPSMVRDADDLQQDFERAYAYSARDTRSKTQLPIIFFRYFSDPVIVQEAMKTLYRTVMPNCNSAIHLYGVVLSGVSSFNTVSARDHLRRIRVKISLHTWELKSDFIRLAGPLACLACVKHTQGFVAEVEFEMRLGSGGGRAIRAWQLEYAVLVLSLQKKGIRIITRANFDGPEKHPNFVADIEKLVAEDRFKYSGDGRSVVIDWVKHGSEKR